MNTRYKIINALDNSETMIEEQMMLFGVASDNTYRLLPEAGSSDYHAILLQKNRKLFLIDLVSSNGTFVNGQRIYEPAELKHNDIIFLARMEFRIVDLEMRSETLLFDDSKRVQPLAAVTDSQSSAAGKEIEKLTAEEKAALPRLVFTDKKIVSSQFDSFFPLNKDSITVGRAKDNDLIIPETSVSTRHFLIFKSDDGSYYIRNLSSTNGTYLNNVLLAEDTVLNARDLIKFGRVEVKFILPISEQKTQYLGDKETFTGPAEAGEGSNATVVAGEQIADDNANGTVQEPAETITSAAEDSDETVLNESADEVKTDHYDKPDDQDNSDYSRTIVR